MSRIPEEAPGVYASGNEVSAHVEIAKPVDTTGRVGRWIPFVRTEQDK